MERLAETRDDPNAFSELVFGTPLHSGQRSYADNAHGDVNFCLPGNSWGKTEFIVRYAAWMCWWKHCPAVDEMVLDENAWETYWAHPYKGLIASYNYPIAKESWDRFLTHMKNREELQCLVASKQSSDPVRLTFTNGAVLDWGSLDGQGKLVEAARRQFIMVDEAGHIPDLSYTFDSILFPRTMGVGGVVHLLGTPKAHSDPYLLEVYEKGKDGGDGFYYSHSGSVLENEYWSDQERRRVLRNPRYVVGWTECDGCTDHLKDSVCLPDYGGHPVLTQMGRQVILGAFVIAGGYFFNRGHVQRLFTGQYEVKWQGENHFCIPYVDRVVEEEDELSGWVHERRRRMPPGNRLYAAAFDLGGNKPKTKKHRGSDPTVGFVVDYTERPWRIVRYDFIEGGDMDWEQKYELMAKVYRDFELPYLLIDATGQADSVVEALQLRGVHVEGVQFGGAGQRKYNMLRNLQLVFEMNWGESEGALRSPLVEGLKYELDHYVLPDDDIRQDRVMALAMVCHEIAQWELPAPQAGEFY